MADGETQLCFMVNKQLSTCLPCGSFFIWVLSPCEGNLQKKKKKKKKKKKDSIFVVGGQLSLENLTSKQRSTL